LDLASARGVKRATVTSGIVAGAVTSLPAIALLLFGERAFGLTFPPYDVFEALTRWLPIAAKAKSVEQLLAVVLSVGLAGVLGALATRMSRVAAALVPPLLTLGATAASQQFLGRGTPSPGEALWSLVVMGAWGALLSWSLDRVPARLEPQAR
jgi:hypothetical protein